MPPWDLLDRIQSLSHIQRLLVVLACFDVMEHNSCEVEVQIGTELSEPLKQREITVPVGLQGKFLAGMGQSAMVLTFRTRELWSRRTTIITSPTTVSRPSERPVALAPPRVASGQISPALVASPRPRRDF